MSTFQFKQFRLQQDKCAMKIGTDGVLLGAWANIAQASSILDIGTGTGLLALMAAQRNTKASIHAVEINAAAQQQAKNNFVQSPWSNRLTLFPYAVQDFLALYSTNTYDSILCNPPYYPVEQNSFIKIEARRQARSTIHLDFRTLLDSAQKLLNPRGNFSLILPQKEAQQFLNLALQTGWSIAQEVAVIPKVGKISNRVLLELKRFPVNKKSSSLVLRQASASYTLEFENLHQDFLLFL